MYSEVSKTDGKTSELGKLRNNQPAIVMALLDELYAKIPKADGMKFTSLNEIFQHDPWVIIPIYTHITLNNSLKLIY